MSGSGISASPHLAPDRQPTPAPCCFLEAGYRSCCPANSIKAFKEKNSQKFTQKLLLYPFNGLFSRTTWVSRYQKGKTSLDLNEARDYGVSGCSGINWIVQTICTSLQTDNHTSTSSLNFYRPAFWHQTNSVKALKAQTYTQKASKIKIRATLSADFNRNFGIKRRRYANNLHCAPDIYSHIGTLSLKFYGLDALLTSNQHCQCTEGTYENMKHLYEHVHTTPRIFFTMHVSGKTLRVGNTVCSIMTYLSLLHEAY